MTAVRTVTEGVEGSVDIIEDEVLGCMLSDGVEKKVSILAGCECRKWKMGEVV